MDTWPPTGAAAGFQAPFPSCSVVFPGLKKKAVGVNISSSYIISCWWIYSVSLCVCFSSDAPCGLFRNHLASCFPFPPWGSVLVSVHLALLMLTAGALQLLTQPPLSSTFPGLWWEIFAGHGEGRSAFLGYSRTYRCAVQAIVYW